MSNLFYEQLQKQSEPVMTPAEFAAEMKAIIERNTSVVNDHNYPWYEGTLFATEDCHREHDKLMMILLRQLGYGEGIDIFESTKKWYA